MIAVQLLVLLVALHTADAKLDLWDSHLNCTHKEWGPFCDFMDAAYDMNEKALDVMQKDIRDANGAIVNLTQLDVKEKQKMLKPLLDVLKQEVDALTEMKESCKDDTCGGKKSSWCDDIMNWVSQAICALAGALIAIADESRTKEANETFTGLCSDWIQRNRTFFDLTQSLGKTLLSTFKTN